MLHTELIDIIEKKVDEVQFSGVTAQVPWPLHWHFWLQSGPT